MSNHACRPEGMPWLSPYLTVVDGQKAIDFYKAAFGFDEIDVVKDDDGKVQHAELSYYDQVVMLGAENAFGSEIKAPVSLGIHSPVTLYLYCEDVDALFQRAQQAGAQVASEPQDAFWGDRMCALIDPDGHSWSFATKIPE